MALGKNTPGENEKVVAPEVPSQCLQGRHWQSLDWQLLLLIFVCGAIIFLPGLNSFGIIDPSDGLYSEGAREMIELKNWTTPYFNYEPFFEKPILTYWLIIASYKVFGVSEWAARLPSVITAVSTAIITFALSRYFIRRRAALFAALILMSNPLYAVVGHVALTDMPLTFFLTTAMLCFLRRLHGDVTAIGWWGCVALGLAVLTKGPLPVVIVGSVILAYFAITIGWAQKEWWRIWWHRLSRLQPLVGSIIVMIVALPWYVYESITTEGKFFNEFFVHQNLGRLAGTVNHQMPWWYYLPVLIGGFFPWIVFVFLVPKTTGALLRRSCVTTCAKSLAIYSTCWSAIVFLLFSAITTKLATYILVTFPPLAILCGILIDRWIRLKPYRNLFWMGVITFVLLTAAICSLPLLARKLTAELPTSVCAELLGGAITIWFGMAVYTFLIYKRQAKYAFYSLIGCTIIGIAAVVPSALNVFDRQLDVPLRDLVFKSMAAKASLAMYMRDSPAAVFYLRKKVPYIRRETEQDYQDFLRDSPAPHWLLVTGDIVSQVQARHGTLNLIERRGKWYLFSLD